LVAALARRTLQERHPAAIAPDLDEGDERPGNFSANRRHRPATLVGMKKLVVLAALVGLSLFAAKKLRAS